MSLDLLIKRLWNYHTHSVYLSLGCDNDNASSIPSNWVLSHTQHSLRHNLQWMQILARLRKSSQRTPSPALADSSTEEVLYTLDHPDLQRSATDLSQSRPHLSNASDHLKSYQINLIILPMLCPSAPHYMCWFLSSTIEGKWRYIQWDQLHVRWLICLGYQRTCLALKDCSSVNCGKGRHLSKCLTLADAYIRSDPASYARTYMYR